MNKEKIYIFKRKFKAAIQSIPFYLFRILPINKRKIVFCCIEGTLGYSCNPKYIAEKIIEKKENIKIVWLVNDISKKFPKEIKVIKNNLINRAFQLTTAKVWIDNSRKQLEVRKRKNQLYIQTWHAKLGFKPTCLDRGKSFSKIAYMVSKHDSDMIDCVLSNSQWYDNTLSSGMLYNGKALRTGSPRCDILINDKENIRKNIRLKYKLESDAKIIMYAPTFRGGSQGVNRSIHTDEITLDYQDITAAFEKKFGGKWYIFLRLHPQLTARNITANSADSNIIDVSKPDDMYEILAGCDSFITDYSSAAFDAMVMNIPIFLYADDYCDYVNERGKLLWDLRKLPFPLAESNEEMSLNILAFDENKYADDVKRLMKDADMNEDGNASERVMNYIKEYMEE